MFGVLRSLREGLAKTRKSFTERVEALVLGEKIDESVLNELEEALSRRMWESGPPLSFLRT